MLKATLDRIDASAIRITLVGELDAGTAPLLKEKIEQAAPLEPKRLLLDVKDLAFLASAGIRVLVFAKQKMRDVDIYVIAPREEVLDVLQMTGLQYSVHIVESAEVAIGG